VTLLFVLLLLQSTPGEPVQTSKASTYAERQASFSQRQTREAASLFSHLAFHSAGPVEMGGRLIGIVGFPTRRYEYLAAYASGGLMRTTNQGASWTPLFDQMPSITLGALAVEPSRPDEIWLGSGEVNSSRSSYAGTGVYYSPDGGLNWQHKGLGDSHHIGAIVLHPTRRERLWVAAMGPLYSSGGERGVFRSDDTGTSWQQILPAPESCGAVSLAIDPANPEHLLATLWQRTRRAWNFSEAGPDSALMASHDGGNTWQKISNGLPDGAHVGRMGVAFAPSQPQRVYLALDNQAEHPSPKPPKFPLNRKALRTMSQEQALALTDEEWDRFLKENQFHPDYKAEKVKAMLKSGEISLQDVREYISDGNAALFDREVVGIELYRSDDGGQSWQRTHAQPLPDFAYSYGYYFGKLFPSPHNPDHITLLGVPLLHSEDGGVTFSNLNEPNVHVDHHALWIDPADPRHQALGNDGGIYFTHDGGAHWTPANNAPVGQFYTIAYDMATPYRIYGGLQDNGVWRGSPEELTPEKDAWHRLGGGDGAFVQVDFRDNQTTYTGYQFGHYRRSGGANGSQTIFPRHRFKEDPYRFNWMTPILLSRHHSDILYLGANRLLRSLDQGATWQALTPDLTTRPQQGDVPYGTLTAITEGHSLGQLLLGTDDGKVWRMDAQDGLVDLSAGLPTGLWVSSLAWASGNDKVMMVTLTGYRNDDFRSYIFRSDDGGASWQDVRGDLPDEPCNQVLIDPDNAKLLYLGTDLGAWFSMDAGSTWHPFTGGLPKVPVYALALHPREQDLILATHGRSVFVAPIASLRQIAALDRSQLQLLPPEKITYDRNWGDLPGWWDKYQKPARASFTCWLPQDAVVELTITNEDKKILFQMEKKLAAGLQVLEWDFTVPEKHAAHRGENGLWYASAGALTLSLQSGKNKASKELQIQAKNP